jgi:hypothetical protein
MHKIIIQPGRYRGLYQIILLQRKKFLIIKWWKNIAIKEYHEEQAFSKFSELVQKLNIELNNIYDWSGAGSNIYNMIKSYLHRNRHSSLT